MIHNSREFGLLLPYQFCPIWNNPQFNINLNRVAAQFTVDHVTKSRSFFKFKSSLQNIRWALSIISLSPKPHTSHRYSKIGLTILSNRSSWHFIFYLYLRPSFKTSYNARVALSTIYFFVTLKLPVFVKTIPR
jgi:hypothetical protein